jgi:hypothetical protein
MTARVALDVALDCYGGRVWRHGWEEVHSGSDGDAVPVQLAANCLGLLPEEAKAMGGLVAYHVATVVSESDWSCPACGWGLPWLPLVGSWPFLIELFQGRMVIQGDDLKWRPELVRFLPSEEARARLARAGERRWRLWV